MQMSEKFTTDIVNRAAKMLESAGADYAIVLGDKRLGNLEVRPPRGRKMNGKYAHGERREYYKQYLDTLKGPGDYVAIPFDKYEAEELRSGICSVLCSQFGVGAYTTSVNRKAEIIEVMLT
jgi:hypothetical protein